MPLNHKPNKENSVSILFSTVKKSKQINQLKHAKSYDDIFAIQELQPYQVKILLNNDRSLKNFHQIQEAEKNYKNYHQNQTFNNQTPNLSFNRNIKQTLSQVLEESVKKQNLLIQKNLFDPFKYFGSNQNSMNIQESARHHRSRLEAMFSENTSPMSHDHSASYRKKSPLVKNNSSKINIDVNRISNSVLFSKLEKLGNLQKKNKQNQSAKIKFGQKSSIKNVNDKENHKPNESFFESSQLFKLAHNNSGLQQTQKKLQFNSNHSNKMKENNENHSFLSNRKMSSQNKTSLCRSKQINCSPKSYVKDAKENYLKMNLNSLQKVRLKLKLTSKN